MRRVICLAALVVALWGARAEAQTIPFGNSTTVKNTRLSAATQQKNIGPATFLGAPFRLRDLFGSSALALDQMIYGLLLVLFIIYMPKGILGTLLAWWRRMG